MDYLFLKSQVMFKLMPICLQADFTNSKQITHTHTHTHIYIYKFDANLMENARIGPNNF